MTSNLKHFVLACTIAVVIVGNVLVAAESSQLRGGSVDASQTGDNNNAANVTLNTTNTAAMSKTKLKDDTWLSWRQSKQDESGLRNNDADIVDIPATITEMPPFRRLDVSGVVFTPVDGGGGISSVMSTSNNNNGNGVAFTAANYNPCPIQMTLDSRSSSQGGGPVSNGNCSGYTGGKCEYSRDNKSYARCDCQRINNRVNWRCYPNP